jgi:hypothetical protein
MSTDNKTLPYQMIVFISRGGLYRRQRQTPGKPYTPTELKPDDNEGFGVTHSICSSRALEHFKHAFGFNRIQGITVATDGVADSFIPQKYLEFTVNLRAGFLTAPKTAAAELQEKTMPYISEQGSRDDVVIAGVWHGEPPAPQTP